MRARRDERMTKRRQSELKAAQPVAPTPTPAPAAEPEKKRLPSFNAGFDSMVHHSDSRFAVELAMVTDAAIARGTNPYLVRTALAKQWLELTIELGIPVGEEEDDD
jgi:hypothetical protein